MPSMPEGFDKALIERLDIIAEYLSRINDNLFIIANKKERR